MICISAYWMISCLLKLLIMAQCKLCNKKGLFLSVNQTGLCKYCNVKFQSAMHNNMRRLQDCENLIETSKNPKTISGRLDFLIELLLELKVFEDKNIPVLTHPIQELIVDKSSASNERLLNILNLKFLTAKEKADKVKSEKAKQNVTDKFTSEAIDFKTFININGTNYDECMVKIDNMIEDLIKA
jgi:hypothetical protein